MTAILSVADFPLGVP